MNAGLMVDGGRLAVAKRKGASDPARALEEAARRELARRRLLEFARFMNVNYEATPAHHLIAEKLEQVERFIVSHGQEGIGRLMIFMPPRHGKTELTKLFQAWFLGRNPDLKVITTSYSADLANDNSRAVRDMVMSKKYAAVFGDMASRRSKVEGQETAPVQIAEDARSVAAWSLKAPHRGGMLSAGVGGGITGRGAHLLNIDDPFKNRDEASSEAHRRRVLSWYRSVAYTRLEKGGAVVLINTRWDQEDLSGELLKHSVSDELGDAWEVVFLPAFALPDSAYPKSMEDWRENMLRGIFLPMGGDQLGRPEGAALWPGKYDEERLRTIQANAMDFEFAAQYQQMPRLAIGNFFDDSDFEICQKAPADLQWFRYIDLALGESKTSDFNACIAVALDGVGNLWLRDRLKVRNLEQFLPVCRQAMLSPEERHTTWGVEDVAFQALVWRQFMTDPSLVNVPITRVRPEGDKVQRARAWQLRAKQGKVKLVRGVWNIDFIREVTAFPEGRHDDDVDTVSGGVKMVEVERRRGMKAKSWKG